MHLSFYILPLVCECLESLLLWRLWSARQLRSYPYLFAFVSYDFVRTPVGLAVAYFWASAYGWTYWATEPIAAALKFLVILEVVRGLFPAGSALRHLVWNVIRATGTFMIPVVLALCWSQASLLPFHGPFVPPVFEQYLNFAQALLLLVAVAVARYYGISFGRNMRGLASGFGLYLSIYTLNFATYQIVRGFLPYLQLLSSASYTALIAFWLWAFWEYAPSPEHVSSRRRCAWEGTVESLVGHDN